jgi:hypothetical protein
MEGVTVGEVIATEVVGVGFAATICDHDQEKKEIIPPMTKLRTIAPPASAAAMGSKFRLTCGPEAAEIGSGGGTSFGGG